ncbi:MAG: redox-sensing transcriptional repressor Rex [Bacteroidales bacterium]|jgi:redox-sensing transcriptional repressor|nr:redox-sensing transcriptional repressor Rex [Bacteroidales bacterium]MDD3701518.1 redox-sensing transcriptional repressor Rex [Bacteroidales bacterium]MDY0369246.1 redox-sensing transcriptional repressor Rex [Bacteroidales bacterium]
MLELLPEKTVERLSQYRRVLLNYQYVQNSYIFSHVLARILKINSATVRRDLMLIGVEGDLHKGYDIGYLIQEIGKAIDSREAKKVCFVGIGEFGKTVAEYFHAMESKLIIAANFYFDGHKAVIRSDVPSYPLSRISEIVSQENITICVLAVPNEFAHDISTILIHAGIRGILNFSSAFLQLPPTVYVENYDMITKLEKIAYFVKDDA